MPTCSFCKKSFKEPRGLTIFTFDGRTVNFCSSKCRRNVDLKRDPKKVNWIRKHPSIKLARTQKLERVSLEAKEDSE